MAVSYPIGLPTTPGYRSVSIQPRAAVAISSSPYTYQQQTYTHPGQMWTGQFELPPMSRAEAAPWVAALTSLNGIEGTFCFGDPAWATPRGTATGTPLVKGASQTGYDLITDGWTANIEALKRGDWLQIGLGSSARLYQVVNDANTGTNLLTYSNLFTNAAWSKTLYSGAGTAPVVTAGYFGPYGQPAFRLQANAGGSGGSDYSGIQQVVSGLADPHDGCGAVWMKSNTGASQTVSIISANTGSSKTVTTEWQRFSTSGAAFSSTTDLMRIWTNPSIYNTTQSIDILICEAQFSTGTTLIPYNPTTSAAKTTSDETTITLWPRLRSSPADNEAIYTRNPCGIWRLAAPVPWAVSVDSLINGLTVQFVEAI
jgi:hypothetical protein